MKVRQRPVTLDGEPIEGENEGSPLYIMAKEVGSGAWLLDQNTVVLDS